MLVMFFGALRDLLFGFFVGRIDFICFRTRAFRRSAFVRKSFQVFVIYFLFRFFLGGIDFLCLRFGVRSSALCVGCSIGCGENTFLCHASGCVVLRIRDVLGKRRHFLLA
jgi:hypothetical protein